MVKIKVIASYIDKDTGKKIFAGKSLDVSDERGAELIAKGHAKAVADVKDTAPKTEES